MNRNEILCGDCSRRTFLRGLGLGSAALLVPGVRARIALAATPPPRDALVCVFLRGGMDGLSAVVPWREDGYYDARPTVAVPPDRALDLDGRFGLHPALSPLHALFSEGRLAIVHAAGNTHPTRSHFDAMEIMERGAGGVKEVRDGWIARHLELAGAGASPFASLAIGYSLPESLRGEVPSLVVPDLASFRVRAAASEAARFEEALWAFFGDGGALSQAATLALGALEGARDAVAGYEPAPEAAYPQHPFGSAMRQIAQLLRADAGVAAACVDFGGWDLHVGMGTVEQGAMASNLAALGAGLFAFVRDLGAAIDRVTVVVMSEFGRRVAENGNGGTDHGHGNCLFVLGGGIRGGTVFGDWPGLTDLDRGDLRITTDYRDVLAEILERRLGNTRVGEVFPGHSPTPLGLTL